MGVFPGPGLSNRCHRLAVSAPVESNNPDWRVIGASIKSLGF